MKFKTAVEEILNEATQHKKAQQIAELIYNKAKEKRKEFKKDEDSILMDEIDITDIFKKSINTKNKKITVSLESFLPMDASLDMDKDKKTFTISVDEDYFDEGKNVVKAIFHETVHILDFLKRKKDTNLGSAKSIEDYIKDEAEFNQIITSIKNEYENNSKFKLKINSFKSYEKLLWFIIKEIMFEEEEDKEEIFNNIKDDTKFKKKLLRRLSREGIKLNL